MITPKFTQSIYLLIATASMVTGKPLKDAQYDTDLAWDKLAALKPNVLTTYESPAMVMMVAQGQADVGGIEYSKNIYPYTVAGAPIDMVFPKEGTFAGINCLSFVKGAPEPELGAAFINRMLEPSVQQGLAEATLTAAFDQRPELQARNRQVHGLPRVQDGRDGPVRRRLGLRQSAPPGLAGEIQPDLRKLTGLRTKPASVRLTDLTKHYGQSVAVDRLSLTIEPGELVALLGPSGCGKTTSLRMIAGLVQPSSGEICVNNRSITKVPVHRRNIGMLFQSYALFPHLTVAENVIFGLEMRGIKRRSAGLRVQEALDLVQLGATPGQAAIPAFRRPAATRRIGPRPGHRTRHAAAGRTARRTGQAFARKHAG